jgi:uncharacterized protein YecT (DUF1311 family)
MKNALHEYSRKMHGALLLGIAGCLLSGASLTLAADGRDAWVLSYEGKSTNAFIWDKRANSLIRASLPTRLANDVMDGLGGPPDPVRVIEHRYVSVSACVAHACMMKGFFWIDAQSGAALGATVVDNALLVGSKNLAATALPAPARQALSAWLSDNDIEPSKLEFMNAGGATTRLAQSELNPARGFRPPLEGPSFDCTRAKTRIELTICNDPILSKQDLELAAEFRQLRHGFDTVSDQNALRAFQREWLKRRDVVCAGSAQVASCVAREYGQQQQRLRNWLPPR